MNYKVVTPSSTTVIACAIVWVLLYAAIIVGFNVYHSTFFVIAYVIYLALSFVIILCYDCIAASINSGVPDRCPYCRSAMAGALITCGIPFGKSSVTYECRTEASWRRTLFSVSKVRMVRSLECCEKDDAGDAI